MEWILLPIYHAREIAVMCYFISSFFISLFLSVHEANPSLAMYGGTEGVCRLPLFSSFACLFSRILLFLSLSGFHTGKGVEFALILRQYCPVHALYREWESVLSMIVDNSGRAFDVVAPKSILIVSARFIQ